LALVLAVLGGLACETPAPRSTARQRAMARREARRGADRGGQEGRRRMAEGEPLRRGSQGDVAGGLLEERTAGSAESGGQSAIFGNPGRGAFAGIAADTASSVVRGFFEAQRLSPEVEEYTRRCLEERGYDLSE